MRRIKQVFLGATVAVLVVGSATPAFARPQTRAFRPDRLVISSRWGMRPLTREYRATTPWPKSA